MTDQIPNAPQAPFVIRGQYLKDLSFENPFPLRNLAPSADNPDISVGIEVGFENLGDRNFEVVLHITAHATRKEGTLFLAEVKYAGLFAIGDIPVDLVQPLLMIEGPRYLFPYARNIISDSTREGGFAPLTLSPVDFAALYQQQHGNIIVEKNTPEESEKNSAKASEKPEKEEKKASPRKKKATS